MRLLILCAVFSVLVAVSFANPVKTHIRDVMDSSSDSEESVENKNIEENLSSQEEKVILHHNKKDEVNSSESTEEEEEAATKDLHIVKDEIGDASSSEENNIKPKKQRLVVVFDEGDIIDLKKLAHKSKRSLNIDYSSNANNHLKVKDEGSIKNEKYLKLKRLRRELDSNESNDSNPISPRFVRNINTSEENSSEEQKNAAPVALAEKPDTSSAEHIKEPAEPAKPETTRRRRKSDSSEEDSSEENKKSHENSAAKPAEGIVLAGKHETAPAEHIELAAKPEAAPAERISNPEEEETTKTETSRRRRNANTSKENSSEGDENIKSDTAIHRRNTYADASTVSSENQSGQKQDINEVFVFSNEDHQDSEENFKAETLKINKYVVLDKNTFYKSFEKTKSSVEDYAQGCGNNENSSSEASSEDNETTFI